uniref:Uncharacterized protein n=1 Tax=Serinus canaria TaxID=9135 RepID=A0A8C9NDP0_SERCA
MALERGIPSQSQRCTLNFKKCFHFFFFFFFLPGKKESVPTIRFYLFNELKTLHDERETSQSSFIFIHQIRTGERIKRQKK